MDYFARDCHGLGMKSDFDHLRYIQNCRVMMIVDVAGKQRSVVVSVCHVVVSVCHVVVSVSAVVVSVCPVVVSVCAVVVSVCGTKQQLV
jgi:hypothetical protein